MINKSMTLEKVLDLENALDIIADVRFVDIRDATTGRSLRYGTVTTSTEGIGDKVVSSITNGTDGDVIIYIYD